MFRKPRGAGFLPLITTNSILCCVGRSTDKSRVIPGIRDHSTDKAKKNMVHWDNRNTALPGW